MTPERRSNADTRDLLESDPEADNYRVPFSHGSDPPSAVVVEAVAAKCGSDPRELEPIYEVVDPEALDALFEPAARSGPRGDGEVSFRYHGYEVAVRSYGVIEIRPAESGAARQRSVE